MKKVTLILLMVFPILLTAATGEISVYLSNSPESSSTCDATVRWTASNTSNVQVCFRINDGTLHYMHCDGPISSYSLDWFEKSKKYTFYLYAASGCGSSARGELLDEITVPIGNLEADKYSVPVYKENGYVNLNWNVIGYTHAQLWKTNNGSEDIVAASETSGQVNIDWIQENTTYTFRLYGATSHDENDKGILLDEIQVTGVTPKGELEAAMYAIPVESNGKGIAHLTWQTEDYPFIQIWKKNGSGEDIIVSEINNGKIDLDWIQNQTAYTLRLYGATGQEEGNHLAYKDKLLDEIQVAGIDPIQKVVGVNKYNLLEPYLYNKVIDLRLARKAINDASNLGLGFFRFNLSLYNYENISKIFESTTPPFKLKDAYLDGLEQLFLDLKQANIKAVPVLNWNAIGPSQFAQKFGDSDYEFFNNNNCVSKQALKFFIQTIVDLYKDNPQVLFWELHNEVSLNLDLINGQVSTSMFQNHMEWMCDIIRSHDPYHMISSGNTEPKVHAFDMSN